MGGMPPETFRDGKIRSQGSFETFLTAGTFGATSLPLFVWMWSQAKSKIVSILGIVGATIMTVTCFTSTTVVAYVAGVVALGFWPVRKLMRPVRWGIVAILVTLHLIMHGPVWSILEHIDLTGSSSSYHRYMLIDNFIRHFGDWWLLGNRNYASWGFDMWDTCNQYVVYGLSGGLLTFMSLSGHHCQGICEAWIRKENRRGQPERGMVSLVSWCCVICPRRIVFRNWIF